MLKGHPKNAKVGLQAATLCKNYKARTSTPFLQTLRTVALGCYKTGGGGFMMAAQRALLPAAYGHVTLHTNLPVSIAIF